MSFKLAQGKFAVKQGKNRENTGNLKMRYAPNQRIISFMSIRYIINFIMHYMLEMFDFTREIFNSFDNKKLMFPIIHSIYEPY